jgi:hypothetical protein
VDIRTDESDGDGTRQPRRDGAKCKWGKLEITWAAEWRGGDIGWR